MEPTSFNPPCIQVLLADKRIWKQFYPTTEMIVTKVKGRVIFPNLSYKVKGLDVDSMYQMFIFLERVDDIKYKYDHGQWQEFAKGEPPFPIKAKEHPDGVRKGDHWMKDVVSFAHLRITNDRENEDRRTIAVQSMHKFRPVVVVKQIGQDRGQEFRIPLTEFMVVTAYQSGEMIKLKVAHNKFASGIRTKKGIPSSTDNETVSKSSSSIAPLVPGATVHPNWDPTMNFFNSMGYNPTGFPLPTAVPSYMTTSNIDPSHYYYQQNFHSMPSTSQPFAPAPDQNQKHYTDLSNFSGHSHGQQYEFKYPRNPVQTTLNPESTPPTAEQNSLAVFNQPASYTLTTPGQSSNKPDDFLGIAPVASLFGDNGSGPLQLASNWVGTTPNSIPFETNYHSLISKIENPHYGSNHAGSSSNYQN